MSKILVYSLFFAFIFFAGCKTYNDLEVRQAHAKKFKKDLATETNEVLSKQKAYGLNDCIKIALENNLQAKSAQIQQRIAKLERKIAFANFLPVVNLDYQDTRWSHQPKIKFQSGEFALQDQEIRNLTWQFQFSIFDPSTWFLYAMFQRGEESAAFVTKYTMQMIVLDTIINYYHCLTLEEASKSLESQLNAALELEKETKQLFSQGQVVEWQYEQTQLNVIGRQTDLTSCKFALQQAYADLLTSMGLSPFAQINLTAEQPLIVPQGSMEDILCKALIENPQLHIADRKVAIEEEKVKVALAAFLPRLTIFANQTHTSDSFQVYSSLWDYGFFGTMTIFNGFANINEYKAAKERRTAAFVDREQQTLILMLQVLKAYINYQNAQNESHYAQTAYDVSSKHFNEINEKWKIGQVHTSDKLAQMAERDNAQMELMSSNFRLQVCIATLQNVMGITDISKIDEKKNESAKQQ